jgi:hypothetical protein
MSKHDELSPADNEVVETLRSLAPASARIDPVAASYAAGRNSAKSQVLRWRAFSAVLLVAGTASWFVPAGESTVPEVRPQSDFASAAPGTNLADAHAQSLVALQQAMYRNGIQSMPATSIPRAGSIRVSDRL